MSHDGPHTKVSALSDELTWKVGRGVVGLFLNGHMLDAFERSAGTDSHLRRGVETRLRLHDIDPAAVLKEAQDLALIADLMRL